MSTYPLRKRVRRWEQGKLTDRQMLGQLVLHLLDHEGRILKLEYPSSKSSKPPNHPQPKSPRGGILS